MDPKKKGTGTKKEPSKPDKKHEATKTKPAKPTSLSSTTNKEPAKTTHKVGQSDHKLIPKKKEESVTKEPSPQTTQQIPSKKTEDEKKDFIKQASKHISKGSVEISKENSKKDLTESEKTTIQQRVHHEKKASEVGARSSSQIKETEGGTIKKYAEEKKEMMKQITALKKENMDLKKKCEEFDKLNNDLMDEVDESQKSAEQFLKEKNEMEATTKKATNDLKDAHKQNDELKKQITALQEDMEILNEELSTKELELEVAAKKFNEYKEKVEKEKLKGTKTESVPPTEQPKPSSQGEVTSEAAKAKISELEDVISALTSELKSATEQRDYAISYYKEQMAKLNEELTDATNKASVISEKDDLIRQLTEKLKDEEAIIESLKSQITALSPANDMYEQIIIEKDELETQLEELKAENEKLKEDLNNDEEMVNDLDSALKISEQMMRQSQDEALKARNNEAELIKKLEEAEMNEKTLIAKMNELKQINNIIKEEIAKFKDTNLDLDDVLNKNLTTTSKIQTLQRQKVLIAIENIDIEKYIMKNKLVDAMIPRKMLLKGSIDVFEKFINIQTLRKKTVELIYNILENDIITEDMMNEKNNKEGDSKMEQVEGENLKKLITFYKSVLVTLMDYNSILFKLEILLSKCDGEKFIELCTSENFVGLYSNICAGSQFIDVLVNMIKNDSFSIQYQSNADSLKTLNGTMQTQITSLEIPEDYLYCYCINLLSYYIKVAIMFKLDRIDVLVSGDKIGKLTDTAKNIHTGYKNIKKLLHKLNEKFFTVIPYKVSNNIFDISSSYYTNLIDTLNSLGEDQSNSSKYNEKYDSLVEVSNKVCVIANSSLEKYEKDKENKEEAKDEITDHKSKLPIEEWSTITSQLYEELESITKMKDELDESSQKLKQAKLEKAEIEAQLEDLKRSKAVNDSKLGELVVKVGRITQLESSNEENLKRIEKYKVAVDGLQKNLEDSMAKAKEFKQKYEHLLSKKETVESRKSRLGVGNSISAISNMAGNYAPIINTVCQLQKERKFLKSKLMKEKLVNLIEENDSYMNKFIQKDLKISKHDNEKDFYRNIEDNVKNLNSNYDKIRQKLCLPKVFDLSSEKYNYTEAENIEDITINKMRIDYMKDADKILYNMFGDNTLDKTFKEVIDNDISRTLQYYADKKLLVGKIRFMEQEQKNKNDVNVNTVPVILSEESLKLLNKTFIH